jgi:DeoR/GlpR family transcriptional regulator of sugar metabolism
MLANQRREVILDMIKEDGHIKVVHNFKNLTVITNALNIAFILGGEPGINLIVNAWQHTNLKQLLRF